MKQQPVTFSTSQLPSIIPTIEDYKDSLKPYFGGCRWSLLEEASELEAGDGLKKAAKAEVVALCCRNPMQALPRGSIVVPFWGLAHRVLMEPMGRPMR